MLIWASGGQPKRMIDSNINGWFPWLQILGGTMHLATNHNVENDISPGPRATGFLVRSLSSSAAQTP